MPTENLEDILDFMLSRTDFVLHCAHYLEAKTMMKNSGEFEGDTRSVCWGEDEYRAERKEGGSAESESKKMVTGGVSVAGVWIFRGGG